MTAHPHLINSIDSRSDLELVLDFQSARSEKEQNRIFSILFQRYYGFLKGTTNHIKKKFQFTNLTEEEIYSDLCMEMFLLIRRIDENRITNRDAFSLAGYMTIMVANRIKRYHRDLFCPSNLLESTLTYIEPSFCEAFTHENDPEREYLFTEFLEILFSQSSDNPDENYVIKSRLDGKLLRNVKDEMDVPDYRISNLWQKTGEKIKNQMLCYLEA